MTCSEGLFGEGLLLRTGDNDIQLRTDSYITLAREDYTYSSLKHTSGDSYGPGKATHRLRGQKLQRKAHDPMKTSLRNRKTQVRAVKHSDREVKVMSHLRARESCN